MHTYKVLFYTQAHWAQRTLTTKTPGKALTQARSVAEGDGYWSLAFDNYDKDFVVEHIEVLDDDGHAVATWQANQLLCRLAAGDLLDALEVALKRLEFGNKAGEEDAYIALAKAAIAKAKPPVE